VVAVAESIGASCRGRECRRWCGENIVPLPPAHREVNTAKSIADNQSAPVAPSPLVPCSNRQRKVPGTEYDEPFVFTANTVPLTAAPPAVLVQGLAAHTTSGARGLAPGIGRRGGLAVAGIAG
jgi:hypothetical protein